MSIICKLFGHKPGMGYYNHDGGGYLTVIGGPIDGLGTEHARVFSECPRCGERFKVGNLHLSDGRVHKEGLKMTTKEELRAMPGVTLEDLKE